MQGVQGEAKHRGGRGRGSCRYERVSLSLGGVGTQSSWRASRLLCLVGVQGWGRTSVKGGGCFLVGATNSIAPAVLRRSEAGRQGAPTRQVTERRDVVGALQLEGGPTPLRIGENVAGAAPGMVFLRMVMKLASVVGMRPTGGNNVLGSPWNGRAQAPEGDGKG